MNMRNLLSKRMVWQLPGEPAGGALAEDAPAVIPADAPGDTSGDTADTGPDLSFIPEEFHTDGKPDLTKFKEHYAAVSKKPELPESYEYSVPEDINFQELGLPEGMTLDFKLDDPAVAPVLAELSATLKELGAPAEFGAKIGGLITRYEARKLAGLIEAQKAEFSGLGTPEQANQRISNVVRSMESILPADQVEALQGATKSAKAMMALEKLLGPRNLAAPAALPDGGDVDPLAARYPNSRTK